MATTTTTTVCKNSISCFDSHLHNKNTSPPDTTTTTALTLKLTSSDHPSKNHHHHVTTNLQFPNCWGFTTTDNKHHDLPPSSSSWLTKPPRLTPISLALCTEHLGSESGSDIISATDDAAAAAASIFHSSHQNIHSTEISSSESFVVLHQQKADDFPRREIKSPRKPTTFPPPLTTMISPNSLSMRRRRDGSRLIIEAVEAPFANSYLQAERSDGTLRLSFVSYPIAGGGGDEEEEEEECGGETATVAEEEEKEIEDRGMEIESQQEEHAESKMEGDVNNVEKFQQRLSRSSRRCKEGSHGSKELMDSWKPAALWVSTA